MPSAAFEKAESILMEKGINLTKSDVKKIDQLAKDFVGGEREGGMAAIYGTIEHLQEDPRSKLFDNGST